MSGELVETDLAILFGLGAVLISFTCRTFYYGRVGSNDKPAPLWFGRLVFLLVGILFLSAGFIHLFFGFGTNR